MGDLGQIITGTQPVFLIGRQTWLPKTQVMAKFITDNW